MALGLVSGVLSARRTGFGQDIDVNLYDTALFNLSYLSVWTLNGDYTPARSSRSAHASLVPCQLYKTSDGCIYIMCNKEKFWITLCEEIGRADLLSDSRLVDFSARLKHRDYLTEAIDEALSVASSSWWLERLQGKVPVAPVRTPREALSDHDLVERGRITPVKLTSGAKFDHLASPISSDAPPVMQACSPMGADTDDILRELGYDSAEIENFRKQDLI